MELVIHERKRSQVLNNNEPNKDALLLTLKSGDLDIEGTKRLDEIYRTFTKSGSKAYLVCNRIAGYCVPGAIKPDSKALFSNSSSSAFGSTSINSQATVQLREE